MDCFTLIASIIESLAWPTATIVLVLLFKNEIVKMAPFIKRLKAGPVEAEFEREIKQLRESVPVQNDLTTARIEDTASKNFLFQLAEFHPRSAILESWVRLEVAARAALAQEIAAAPKARYIPAARLAEPLAQAELINQSQITLYHELRRLRNEVAHAEGFEPTQESARSYITLASFLRGYIEGRTK